MYGYMIRGLDLIILGCGGTSTLPREVNLAVYYLHEPQRNQQSADGGRVSTLCGMVSTWRNSVFVPGLLEL